MRRAGWVIALIMVMGMPPAWAARTAVHEAAESQDYGRKFGGMIGRGVLAAGADAALVAMQSLYESDTGNPLKPGTQKVTRSTAPEANRKTPQPVPFATPVKVPTSGGPVLVSSTTLTRMSMKLVTTLSTPRPIIPPNFRP